MTGIDWMRIGIKEFFKPINGNVIKMNGASLRAVA